MSSYLVLARKYRPQNFSQLIGQEVLVRTLKNSIKNNRLHQAFMLHGIRGVGKTTTARIIAKSINCLDEQAKSQGDCCTVCENCRLIAASHHQDVVEIDAASRTDVAGIREIIDSIAYAPVTAHFKIYIIDEVHMLSDHAFNALLKTLEEPPPHVKFIFATTEIREVPQTILSRCQRFDLRRLDESEIAKHLENILQQEGFEAEKSALSLISRASEGSVRDGLSILDQALSNNNHQKTLPTAVVEEMLGVLDNFAVIELLEKLLGGDFIAAQSVFKQLYAISSDLIKIANDLLEIIYKTTCTKLIDDYRLDEFSANQASKIREIANLVEVPQLSRFWQVVSKSIAEIKSSSLPKMAFEMMMVKLCHLAGLPDLKEILSNLDQQNSVKSDFVEEFKSDAKNFSEISSARAAKNAYIQKKEISDEGRIGGHIEEGQKDEKKDQLIDEILGSFAGSKII